MHKRICEQYPTISGSLVAGEHNGVFVWIATAADAAKDRVSHRSVALPGIAAAPRTTRGCGGSWGPSIHVATPRMCPQ